MPYTIRSVLVLLAAFAILAAVCFAFPAWLANYVLAPLWFIAIALYVAGTAGVVWTEAALFGLTLVSLGIIVGLRGGEPV